MKPIYLKMCAFGPYKDEVSIDFTKFYEDGIFLITGDTGSGKTTIFDAISYALFGTASGSNRDKSSFRSDFADDTVKTYVFLSFSHKGIIYKVVRYLSYKRKKLRGKGDTLVNGDASIEYDDVVITGDSNVSNKCIEILGINGLQFKQISMLAQGEFLKLLLAKSTDRAIIFRKIFDTGIYKTMSDVLKDKYLLVKRNYEDEMLGVDSLRDSVIFDNDEDCDIGIDNFMTLLKKEIDSDCKDIDSLDVKKKNLLDKIQKYLSMIDNANIINDNFDKYETNINLRNELLRDNKDIDLRRNLVCKNKIIYEEILPLYDRCIDIDKEIINKKNILSNKRGELEDNLLMGNKVKEKYNNIGSMRKIIDSYKRELDRFENMKVIFEKINKLRDELEGKRRIYNLLEYNDYNVKMDKVRYNNLIKDKYFSKQKEFEDLKKRFDEVRDRYNEMYDKFISCQAGLIALKLEDGDACPVCGSCSHPNKARYEGIAIGSDDLEEKKNELDDCQKILEKCSEEISALKKDIEFSDKEIMDIDISDIKKKLELCQVDVNNMEDVSNFDIDEVREEINYIKALIDSNLELVDKDFNFNIIDDKIKEILDNIGKIEKDISDITDEYDDLEKKRVKLELEINMYSGEIDDLGMELTRAREKYVNKYMEYGYDREEDYFKEKLDYDKYLDFCNKVEEYDKNLVLLNSKIETLEELIRGKERIIVSELEKNKCDLDDELMKVEDLIKSKHSKLDNNKKVYDKLKMKIKDLGKLEKKIGVYEDLSNTANGNIKGKNKLEFEQYVQAYYFDNVLESANKRFSYMTDSRYLLVRRVVSSKLSDKLGLELEVFDNYTGKRRDVSSLSGGESFKASLSLALGISDVIQSYAGGIVIDAMFIDEGFGSLDEKSLETAMNTIMMLKDDNNLIGIISHIGELKGMIDKGIFVKKSNNGSEIVVY